MVTPTQIRRQARKIEEEECGLGPLGREVLRFWKEPRPKMWANLKARGITEEAALIAENQYHHKIIELMPRGIGPDDAARLAAPLLQMVSEEEEEEEIRESQARLGEISDEETTI